MTSKNPTFRQRLAGFIAGTNKDFIPSLNQSLSIEKWEGKPLTDEELERELKAWNRSVFGEMDRKWMELSPEARERISKEYEMTDEQRKRFENQFIPEDDNRSLIINK